MTSRRPRQPQRLALPHLAQRSRSDGLAVKLAEEHAHWGAQLPLDDRLRLVGAEGGHPVLQRQLTGRDSGRGHSRQGPACAYTLGLRPFWTSHASITGSPRCLACSLDSSCVNSAGNRSLRVLNSWPAQGKGVWAGALPCKLCGQARAVHTCAPLSRQLDKQQFPTAANMQQFPTAAHQTAARNRFPLHAPSLMKVGPNCRMVSRIHTASTRPRSAFFSGVMPPG